MHPKVREVLDVIEDVLLKSTDEHQRIASDHQIASDLWDILSSLRGPDNEELAAKEATIEVRATAFPRLASILGCSERYFSCYFANNPIFKKNRSLASDSSRGGEHFSYHIRTARAALMRVLEK